MWYKAVYLRIVEILPRCSLSFSFNLIHAKEFFILYSFVPLLYSKYNTIICLLGSCCVWVLRSPVYRSSSKSEDKDVCFMSDESFFAKSWANCSLLIWSVAICCPECHNFLHSVLVILYQGNKEYQQIHLFKVSGDWLSEFWAVVTELIFKALLLTLHFSAS